MAFSVNIPDLTGTDSKTARRLIMQFMREINMKTRVLEQHYDRKIKELERDIKELKENGD